jgi:hypothetical protein
LLVQYTEGTYTSILWGRLATAAPPIPVLPLLAHVPDEFTLPGDPHPNAESARVFALWCAEALVQRGWVPGRDASTLGEAPEPFARLRAETRPPEEWRRLADEARARLAASLAPSITLDDGHGIYQIYGGVNPDGTARPHALLLLARGGGTLELALSPLPSRPDLYPLDVDVAVDGAPLATLHVQGDAALVQRLSLPPGQAPVEVLLAAERWVVTSWDGRSQLSAYHLDAARCIP